jgi:hypothetical protein
MNINKQNIPVRGFWDWLTGGGGAGGGSGGRG